MLAQGCQLAFVTANFLEFGIFQRRLAVKIRGWQVGIKLAFSGQVGIEIWKLAVDL